MGEPRSVNDLPGMKFGGYDKLHISGARVQLQRRWRNVQAEDVGGRRYCFIREGRHLFRSTELLATCMCCRRSSFVFYLEGSELINDISAP